ncbi:hypothetical protein EIN_380440 [Entamoeba invadens IP1]|uniref:U3 small nucleolar RNA-associated protein 15 C-terminal domain-containing protein n=1 Tax=Entamoeba invadens IP1 TaxID=370355 RepID=A0A0A1UAN2_ENTIV|nr:hypothetical protein EIN_380440 [Entamoeba invadens IP1]ELP92117.1 hypothetical protein EIN_380440 [Entamoeba invadens IP1]|eukprot:XP_004258888.1 hypothetical protein EIN_380440 [Entamoeba invadens IP1]
MEKKQDYVPFRVPQAKTTKDLEGMYWDAFTPVNTISHVRSKSLKFSPIDSYTFAVCSEMSIFLHRVAEDKTRQMSRHKSDITVCEYRRDGLVIATGCAGGAVKVFDLSTYNVIKTFIEHKQPVNALCWANGSLYSGSSDKTIKCWDLTSKHSIKTYTHHTDAVRCLAVCPTNPNLIASGSYDHTVQLFDTKENKVIQTLEHSFPVESIAFHPVGSILAVANGENINIWDIATQTLLYDYACHTNDINTVFFDSDGQRLFSSSFDGNLNVYETTKYTKLHNITYPAPVISFAMNKDETMFVAALNTGEVIVNQKNATKKVENAPSSAKYFFQGKSLAQVKPTKGGNYFANLLRQIKYSEALDKALETRDETIIMTIIREIIYRNGMRVALINRNENTLQPLMSFLINSIPNPNYTKIIIEVIYQLLDIYISKLGKSALFDDMFFKLQKRLEKEIQLNRNMQELLGQIDLIIGAAECSRKD